MNVQIFPTHLAHANYVVLLSGLGGQGHLGASQIEALQMQSNVLIYDQYES